jgi:hypothetical protein
MDFLKKVDVKLLSLAAFGGFTVKFLIFGSSLSDVLVFFICSSLLLFDKYNESKENKIKEKSVEDIQKQINSISSILSTPRGVAKATSVSKDNEKTRWF